MSVSSFLLYAIIGLLTYIVYKIYKNLTYWESLGVPCESPHFVFGSLYGVTTRKSFAEIWMSYYNKFKSTGAPFAGFYWFQRRAVLVLDIQLAKNILIKEFNKFTDRGFYNNEKDDPLTGQLFILDGHKWKHMRNKLSPTFTSGKMKVMFPIVVKVGEEFSRVIGEVVKKDSIVEVKDLLARFTTDVIGTCAFGVECNSLKNPEAEFRTMGKKVFIDNRHGPWGIAFLNSFPELARKLRMKQTPEHIEKFYMDVVRDTVTYREKNNIKRNDFLDLLIDLKNKKLIKSEHGDELTNLTLEQIAAQAFVFLVAGFETSSTTMGFTLYELAQNEGIQEKAREEIISVLEKHNQEFTYECMREMEYLDQIVSETLRLYTVLPVLNRQCIEDYVVPGHPEYVIKKGMPVLIPAGAIHRDPQYYPNPDTFNPDNFSPEKVKERDSVEWLPFGDGPRNCIGMRFGQMQARVGLAFLLKDFKFSVCQKTEIPVKYDKKIFLIGPEGGIYLKVERV